MILLINIFLSVLELECSLY